MITQGIELHSVELIQAVNNADGTPETYYAEKNDKRTRQAEIWLTQIGVIFKQKDKYFGTPVANGKHWRFK
jgi:hypothetical protein